MNIANLPETKNITEFSDEELYEWLKDYIAGWASKGVGPQEHYDAVKIELMRRSNERILNLTEKIHRLTASLVVLTIILVVFTCIMIFK